MLPFFLALMLTPFNPAVLTLPPEPDYSTTTLAAYAAKIATDRGFDADRFVAVLDCESAFEWDAVGDNGTSLGIAQFRFPERDWGVSSSTVMDPYAAIELMASAWSKGKQAKWSCYHLVAAPRE